MFYARDGEKHSRDLKQQESAIMIYIHIYIYIRSYNLTAAGKHASSETNLFAPERKEVSALDQTTKNHSVSTTDTLKVDEGKY